MTPKDQQDALNIKKTADMNALHQFLPAPSSFFPPVAVLPLLHAKIAERVICGGTRVSHFPHRIHLSPSVAAVPRLHLK